MRFPTVFKVLWHLLLTIFFLSSLWLPSSIASNNALCLQQQQATRKNDNFSARALVERAQNGAYMSPVVFLGTLRSVLVQRDGTVRAWFAVDGPLKMNGTSSRIVATSGKKADLEVVYHRTGACVLVVNQDNLKLGSQYLVFGAPLTDARPSLAATALPIPNEKRTLRAVKRILCKDCAKAPSIAGLKNVRVVEGGKTQLHCHVAGNPVPWVEWYKDGRKIATTRGRVRVRTKRRTSRLVVRNARATDRGVYECRAGNVVQQNPVTSRATLIVTRRPRKPTTSRPRTSPKPTVTSTASSLWTIEPCPNSDFCLNGGTCIFYKDVREYVCHCAEGFVGLRCHYKDVSISLGEVKNLEQNHDRLFITIVILFVILFCFNWATFGICWLCCFRNQQSSWGNFRKMTQLRKFVKKKLIRTSSSSLKVEMQPNYSDDIIGPRKEDEIRMSISAERSSSEDISLAVTSEASKDTIFVADSPKNTIT